MGFGLVIGFIDHSQAVTTTKCNAFADSHVTDHSTLNPLSILSLVFTIRSLAADLSQSHCDFKYHCNYSACAVFNSHSQSSWNTLILFLLSPFTADSLKSDLLHYQTWVSGYNCIALGRTIVQKTRPLPINGRSLLLRILWNVFTESLLSNGHGADPHRKHLLQHLFYCCLPVLRTLPSDGLHVTIYWKRLWKIRPMPLITHEIESTYNIWRLPYKPHYVITSRFLD
jgi:hypothetical protein